MSDFGAAGSRTERTGADTIDTVRIAASEAADTVKIVVVSDTHMMRMAKALPPRLVEELADADLILHAGDWTSPDVHDLLAAYAPVQGVAGNNDGPAIVERWGYRRIVEVGGLRIGLTHGHLGRGSTEDNARAAFAGESVAIILFGHAHVPRLPDADYPAEPAQPVVFNPGSPTDKRRLAQYSFGIVTISAGEADFRLCRYDSKI